MMELEYTKEVGELCQSFAALGEKDKYASVSPNIRFCRCCSLIQLLTTYCFVFCSSLSTWLELLLLSLSQHLLPLHH